MKASTSRSISRLSITVSWVTGRSNSASIIGGIGVAAIAEIDFNASISWLSDSPVSACAMVGENLVYSAVE